MTGARWPSRCGNCLRVEFGTRFQDLPRRGPLWPVRHDRTPGFFPAKTWVAIGACRRAGEHGCRLELSPRARDRPRRGTRAGHGDDHARGHERRSRSFAPSWRSQRPCC